MRSRAPSLPGSTSKITIKHGGEEEHKTPRREAKAKHHQAKTKMNNKRNKQSDGNNKNREFKSKKLQLEDLSVLKVNAREAKQSEQRSGFCRKWKRSNVIGQGESAGRGAMAISDGQLHIVEIFSSLQGQQRPSDPILYTL